MLNNLAEKYDLRVPRYTSYPTAPHFTEAVGEADYGEWLGALDGGAPVSLYFHIPFCDTLCWFCGCYTKIVNSYQPVADYLESLLLELDLVAERLGGRHSARHLHWGGGSPTLLTPDDWRRMLDAIRARFEVADDAEIAVELDPRETTEAYVAALAAGGVNRVSIGVQDFHPEVQAAVNRIQPFEVTQRVIGWMRAHGIDAVNMDLLYGLPHQTEARVVDMVDLAVSLGPQRLALFGYAHVPWMKKHQRLIDENALPDADQRWRQAEAAAARLVEHGFVRIGFDHFARPDDSLAAALAGGALRRNFQGYTSDQEAVLIGLGASAIGMLPQGYVQNISPLKDYARAVGEGRLPTVRGVRLSPEDRLRRAAIECILCDMKADLTDLCRRHGEDISIFADELAALGPYVEDGICRVAGGTVEVADAYRPFARLVAAAFDAYLEPGGKRHARAV
ncbi:MAG: oxygen-independent coproporphyrinogen III oxidase [Rhodospirillales bacterium]|jgi:oxygen-independent coproporphyrinogen-3 oxidase|nr:oxygen-independent coproporphyrinogen III oxidase [Rhodospirillaceae bacterium]MDP6430202.1 oxygen-independent coproporphyrinogen III oxidase [Rhodospirillales bacterium]MDP6646192.1 oxygen-independent coproporphyrinogen III oxidase [Rhodospirillales bacterium]MDP6840110.1 oxygen-independent coproporphyrinogen III oxidase [Rhodospirillales bacterium]